MPKVSSFHARGMSITYMYIFITECKRYIIYSYVSILYSRDTEYEVSITFFDVLLVFSVFQCQARYF